LNRRRCGWHDSQHVPPAFETMAHWAHVKVITHPLVLMGIHPSMGVFLIDLAQKIKLFKGDISTDMVCGALLDRSKDTDTPCPLRQ